MFFKNWKSTQLFGAATVVLLLTATPAYCQDDLPNVAHKIFDISTRIDIGVAEITPTANLFDRVMGVNHLSWEELLFESDLRDADMVQMFKSYSKLEISTSKDISVNADYKTILTFADSESWQLSYTSNFLIGAAYLRRGDVGRGLSYSSEALSKIPENLETNTTRNALFEVYGLLQIGLTLDSQYEQVLDILDTYLEYAVVSNRQIDPFNLVNNLAVLSSRKGDVIGSIEVLSVAEGYLDVATDRQLLLYNYSYGRYLVQAHRYKEAIDPLNVALSLNEGGSFPAHIYKQLAYVYSNVGSIDELRRFIDLYENELVDLPKSDETELALLRLKSREAYKSGNNKIAYDLLEVWSDRSIEGSKNAINTDREKTALKIAKNKVELSNVIEENSLKDIIIEREKGLRLYTVLALLFILLTAILSIALFIREKISARKYLVARDDALLAYKAKTEFLSVMSHEFKTPLNAIIPVAEALSVRMKDKDDVLLAGLIKTNGESLLTMVENVLVLSVGADGYVSYVDEADVVKVFKGVCMSYYLSARQKGISMSIKLRGPRLVGLHYDNNAFKLVLNNILSNAVKFTDKGNIDALICLNKNTCSIDVTVIDTGIGMEQENVHVYRKPFEQQDMTIVRKADGAGIGLSVIDVVLSAIGGSIGYSTSEGMGTTCRFSVPFTLQDGVDHGASLRDVA